MSCPVECRHNSVYLLNVGFLLKFKLIMDKIVRLVSCCFKNQSDSSNPSESKSESSSSQGVSGKKSSSCSSENIDHTQDAGAGVLAVANGQNIQPVNNIEASSRPKRISFSNINPDEGGSEEEAGRKKKRAIRKTKLGVR